MLTQIGQQQYIMNQAPGEQYVSYSCEFLHSGNCIVIAGSHTIVSVEFTTYPSLTWLSLKHTAATTK